MMQEMFPQVFTRYSNFEYLGFQKEVGDHTIYHFYFRQGVVEIHHIEHIFN